MQKQLKNQKGFTIIEVMIVLVIAAVILLIVFLAVPALQRNSRNTQRKSDVAAVLAAVNEWSNNNSGAMPTTTAQQAAALTNANLGIYSGQVYWGTTWPGDGNTINLSIDRRCTSQTATIQQTRSVAALYTLESSGAAFVQQCTSS